MNLRSDCEMLASKLFSIFIFLVCSVNSYAQSEDSAPSPFPAALTPTQTYKFEKASSKASKDPKVQKDLLGTLKFHEQKDSVRLEFEGRGLEKGHYQIVKIENCEALRRRLLSKKSMPANSDLFAFETEYGHISTEKNLNGQKLSDLELETTALALIKIEKRGSHFIACAQ